MVYLGYDFNPGKIINISMEGTQSVQQSLSPERLTEAKNFLESVRDFIANKLKLFGKHSKLSKDTVGISIMENFTGKSGCPQTEEKQAFHTDYPLSPSK